MNTVASPTPSNEDEGEGSGLASRFLKQLRAEGVGRWIKHPTSKTRVRVSTSPSYGPHSRWMFFFDRSQTTRKLELNTWRSFVKIQQSWNVFAPRGAVLVLQYRNCISLIHSGFTTHKGDFGELNVTGPSHLASITSLKPKRGSSCHKVDEPR